MNHELTAYLDRKFAENEATTRRTVEETVEQATQGLATTRQLEGLATTRQLEDLREEVGEETGGLREEIRGLREHVDKEIRGMREHVDSQIRQTQVMVEDLRGGLERVAEGVVDMSAKIDQQREENDLARREDRALFTSLFQDVKGRVDGHDTRLESCELRLTQLESARA